MTRTRLTLLLLAAASLFLLGASPRDAMIQVLGSQNPNALLGDEARTFDQLVGTWDAEFGFHRPDGTVLHKKGELHFGWVMDGTAIQDLWIGYPAEAGKERSIGTTFRFFDSQAKQWRIVFINPRFNYVVTAQGGREGDRIVLRGTDTDGLPLRWTFREITPQSFHWQGEKSDDGGKTWKLEEDHHMKRRAESAPTAQSSAAFAQLKSLAGEWHAVQDGVPVVETYTVTADDSAVMAETRPDKGSPMITMFTADGDHLLATHYCSAGNQPHLIATSPAGLRDGVAFTFDRVTGMKTPEDWHNTGITIKLDDPNHMTQTWTWLYQGKSGTTVFHYTRK